MMKNYSPLPSRVHSIVMLAFLRNQVMDRNPRVDYASKEYWNERYTEEDHFEWISSGYQKQLGAIAAKGASINDIHSKITWTLQTK